MNPNNNEIYFATNGTNMNMTSINNRNNIINNHTLNSLHTCNNNNNNENLNNNSHHNFINNLSNSNNSNNINNHLDLNSANLSNYQTSQTNGSCYLFRNNHIPSELLSVNNQCQSSNISNSTYTELQPAAYTQQQLPSIDTLGCGNKSNSLFSSLDTCNI